MATVAGLGTDAPIRPLVAFVGPSLDRATAAALAPGVRLYPPVCQGDLTGVVEFAKPRAILIVDGEFGQVLSVWHKEILAALDAGIRVVGASSMGALRAAELDVFGMEGVGEIYEYYRDGWLTDDADVALLHGPADADYVSLTWPLVNVRATAAALHAAGVLDATGSKAVLEAAATVHFTERTAVTIARQLVSDGHDPEWAHTVAAALQDAYVDQKARDAVAGFEFLGRIDAIPAPAAEVPLFLEGRSLEPLRWSDVTLERHGTTMRRYQLVNDVTLHEPDFDELLARACDRYLALELAADVGITASDRAVAEQRREFLARHDLTEETLPEWLSANDLDEAGFAVLLEHEAILTHARRWLLDSRLWERTRRLVIEQLQVEGRYAAAADAAARRRRLTDGRPPAGFPHDRDAVVALVARHMARTSWRPGDLERYADTHGFDGPGGLLVALADADAAATARAEARERFARLLGLSDRTASRDPAAAGTSELPKRPVRPARISPEEPRWALAHLEAHQSTQVLLAAVELGIPAALANGPRPLTELAEVTESDPDRLRRLLRALSALRIVKLQADDHWVLTSAGRALAGPCEHDSSTDVGSAGYGLDEYARDLRANTMVSWARLAEVVRGADPPPYPDSELDDRSVMASAAVLGLADHLVRQTDVPEGGHVIDIGGGLGRTLEALHRARPDLRLSLVERPGTADRAARRLTGRGLATAIDVIAYRGQTALEPPADLVILERVIASLDDDTAADVLGLAARSLAPRGRIEVLDVIFDDTPASAFGDLLALVRSGGRVRSEHEWRRLAARSGLRLVEVPPVPPPYVHYRLEGADDSQ